MSKNGGKKVYKACRCDRPWDSNLLNHAEDCPAYQTWCMDKWRNAVCECGSGKHQPLMDHPERCVRREEKITRENKKKEEKQAEYEEERRARIGTRMGGPYDPF